MKIGLLVLSLCVISCLSQSQVQVHVSLGAVPGEIVFVWSTREATPTTVVNILLNSSWTSFSGGSFQFVDGNNTWSIHNVTVQLTPGTSYTYQVGCSVTGFSGSFTLLVPVDSQPTKFFLYGDLATEIDGGLSWKDIEQMVKAQNAQAIVQLGDMAYNLCSNSSTWGDLFMQDLQPVASYIPYQVCAGNHEAVDNYYNYQARFLMPNNQFWFTYTIGYVRFLAIHTEAFISETEKIADMMSYIVKVLNRSASDRAKYPWMVVYGHRPIYCVSPTGAKACGKQAASIAAYMESVLNQYKVDLYVSGHVHNYQRTTPVYQGNVVGPVAGNTFVNPTAPIYVVSGGPGADGDNDPVNMNNAPAWLEAVQQDFSFSLVTATQTTLVWQQILSSDESVFDTFTILKNL